MHFRKIKEGSEGKLRVNQAAVHWIQLQLPNVPACLDILMGIVREGIQEEEELGGLNILPQQLLNSWMGFSHEF